jgi:dsDNA-binding SOS-regulon protein
MSHTSVLSTSSIQNKGVFNVEKSFVKRVKVGCMIVCEVPENIDEWNQSFYEEKNVFLYTGYKDWVWLTNKESYLISIKGQIRNVWIGKACSNGVVSEYTSIDSQQLDDLNSLDERVKRIQTIYARCEKSMYLLDDIHRNYVNNHKFLKNDVVAIKSVAGSGKTTTLLTLSKIHSEKKILYLAFNKSLITEVKSKVSKEKIRNLHPRTFDSLLYELYSNVNCQPPSITDLKPQFIQKALPWFTVKYFTVKKFCCNHFSKFCNDPDSKTMVEYCEKHFGSVKKPLLVKMWESVLKNELTTFESIRKQAYINKWFERIDSKYDMIMIDETQDFDLVMLKLLMEQTTLPKLFVGDPMQSIYQFRGCINAFEYLPKKEALVIEFYSTFRVGDPVCSKIREMFNDCWMISKSKNQTQFTQSFSNDDEYTHLFRTWKSLLTTAENTPRVFIYNYDKKVEDIKKLHEKLSNNPNSLSDDMFEDDLPMFLKSLTKEDLNKLLKNISRNVVCIEECRVKMSTVHSYKGMEDNNIKIDNDLKEMEKWDKGNEDVNDNVYYVALTRGMERVQIPTVNNSVKKQLPIIEHIIEKVDTVNDYTTSCGHVVKIIPVKKLGGSKEGMYQLRVSGPKIDTKYKLMYCEPDENKVVEVVLKYLNKL